MVKQRKVKKKKGQKKKTNMVQKKTNFKKKNKVPLKYSGLISSTYLAVLFVQGQPPWVVQPVQQQFSRVRRGQGAVLAGDGVAVHVGHVDAEQRVGVFVRHVQRPAVVAQGHAQHPSHAVALRHQFDETAVDLGPTNRVFLGVAPVPERHQSRKKKKTLVVMAVMAVKA
jgi:hypothetical protein